MPEVRIELADGWGRVAYEQGNRVFTVSHGARSSVATLDPRESSSMLLLYEDELAVGTLLGDRTERVLDEMWKLGALSGGLEAIVQVNNDHSEVVLRWHRPEGAFAIWDTLSAPYIFYMELGRTLRVDFAPPRAKLGESTARWVAPRAQRPTADEWQRIKKRLEGPLERAQFLGPFGYGITGYRF